MIYDFCFNAQLIKSTNVHFQVYVYSMSRLFSPVPKVCLIAPTPWPPCSFLLCLSTRSADEADCLEAVDHGGKEAIHGARIPHTRSSFPPPLRGHHVLGHGRRHAPAPADLHQKRITEGSSVIKLLLFCANSCKLIY